jgi:hypothetical protein
MRSIIFIRLTCVRVGHFIARTGSAALQFDVEYCTVTGFRSAPAVTLRIGRGHRDHLQFNCIILGFSSCLGHLTD